MWAANPPYVAQPLVELIPSTTNVQLYDPNILGSSYGAPTGTQTFSFPDDPPVGAIHVFCAVRFPAESGTEDRLKISFGSRYSLAIRAVRHSLQTQGTIGDAIIVGPNLASFRPGFPSTFNYLVAALQDNGSDIESKILHLSGLHFFGPDPLGNAFLPGLLHVCAGFSFDESNDLNFYAHIASRPGFGAGTYSMRAHADHEDAMAGPRAIAWTDQSESGFFPRFYSVAAHYGPFMETRIFRPDAEQFRRERANSVVASLRSGALNWGYVLNPGSDIGIANIDCCGHQEFHSASFPGSPVLPRRYVAALGMHPDGTAGYLKPDVEWNSNVGATSEKNQRLASLRIDIPAGILVRRFLGGVLQQNVFGFTPQEITITASTQNCGNNEYIGTTDIDLMIEDQFSQIRYVRTNAFAGITAYEQIANRDAASFEAVELTTRFEAVVRVFLVDEDGNVQAIIAIDQELDDEQAASLLQGEAIDLLDGFNNKNITIQGVSA